jgi:site-specific DNA recombinase
MTVAIYARYSSDNQRDASISDQLRICREFAARQGWTVIQEFTDHAISGATLLRPGFQALMRDALSRRFDVVLAESLDRFSRDQEDTAGLFKRLTFAGVSIVTLAEGDITHLHTGFKGTMNALFLKDLAEKTHRGLRGRVESGKAGGGLCYGYRVVKSLTGGTVTTGEREIEPGEAAIVERIFREYVAGIAPKAIAKRLNQDGIAGPFGGTWSPSTIHGNPKRGTGILNNELYIGRLIWNRLRYVKNPDTGKRISRLNTKAGWITKEIPSLRIVSDELWNAAKDRQSATRRTITRAGNIGFARRPQYLFSGLSKCGVCGAGFIMAGRNRLACFGAREKGTCDNRLTIRRDEVEARVLKALEHRLLNQELFDEFCDEFTRDMNRLRMEHRANLSAAERKDLTHRGATQEADRNGDGRGRAFRGESRAERECCQAGTTGCQARRHGGAAPAPASGDGQDLPHEGHRACEGAPGAGEPAGGDPGAARASWTPSCSRQARTPRRFRSS